MFVVSPALAESHVSMVIDDRELQASVALKKTKVQKYIKTFYVNYWPLKCNKMYTSLVIHQTEKMQP